MYWVEYLRTLDPSKPPNMMCQRMVHPGLRPASGGGLVSPVPLGKVAAAGQMALSLSVLRFIDEDPESKDQIEDLVVTGSVLGGLLTLASNRMCEVVSEIPPGGETAVMAPLPVAGTIDSQLGAPMPEWEEVDSEFRDIVARLTSLPTKAATALRVRLS